MGDFDSSCRLADSVRDFLVDIEIAGSPLLVGARCQVHYCMCSVQPARKIVDISVDHPIAPREADGSMAHGCEVVSQGSADEAVGACDGDAKWSCHVRGIIALASGE
jgi:hypothetical protein